MHSTSDPTTVSARGTSSFPSLGRRRLFANLTIPPKRESHHVFSRQQMFSFSLSPFAHPPSFPSLSIFLYFLPSPSPPIPSFTASTDSHHRLPTFPPCFPVFLGPLRLLFFLLHRRLIGSEPEGGVYWLFFIVSSANSDEFFFSKLCSAFFELVRSFSRQAGSCVCSIPASYSKARVAPFPQCRPFS